MEEFTEEGSVDTSPVVGNEGVGSVAKGVRARHIGGRRMSSRSKPSKGLSPRLILVEMKRGRKRGSANFKGIGASGSRRSGNWSNSRLSSSPGSISVGNQCNSESEAGPDCQPSLPEDMEADGESSLEEHNLVESLAGQSEESVRGSPGVV